MKKLLLALLAFIPLAVVLAAPQEPPAGLDNWVRQSKYIFRGKVQRRNASNLKVLPPDPRTAVVLVENTLDAPKTLADFTGREITVQLQDANQPSAQEDAIFFTNGWLYGESIAVIEVAHLSRPGNEEAIRRQISAIRQKMTDEAFQARITRAALVVTGRVSATVPYEKDTRTAAAAKAPEKPKRVISSEHSADWWKATVDVNTIVKGQSTAHQVDVLFPKSTDEMWINSPKFKVGDQGIWILQNNQQEHGLPFLRVPGLTALDPLDFRPASELPRVRELIKNAQ